MIRFWKSCARVGGKERFFLEVFPSTHWNERAKTRRLSIALSRRVSATRFAKALCSKRFKRGLTRSSWSANEPESVPGHAEVGVAARWSEACWGNPRSTAMSAAGRCWQISRHGFAQDANMRGKRVDAALFGCGRSELVSCPVEPGAQYVPPYSRTQRCHMTRHNLG